MLKTLLMPYTVFNLFPYNLFIWFVAILFLGNIVFLMTSKSITDSMESLLLSGYFYSFSFYLVLSSLSSVFSDMASNSRLDDYDKHKELNILIIIIGLILGSIIVPNTTKLLFGSTPVVDFIGNIFLNNQFALYLLSLNFAIYVVAVILMKKPRVCDEYIDLEDKKLRIY